MSEIEALTEQPNKSKRGRKSKEELKRMAEEQQAKDLAKTADVGNKFNENGVVTRISVDESADIGNFETLAARIQGRVETLKAIGDFTNAVSLMQLKQVKDNKLYKKLGMTWQEYVESIGMSRSKVDEDILYLEAFGEKAFNSMQELGVNYQTMRQFRKLPEESRQELVQQIEENLNDKDALLKTIDDQAERHMREIGDVKNELAAMQGKLADAEKEKKASDTLLADKEHRIKQLLSENQEIKGKKPTPDERIQYWAKQLTVTSYQVGYGGDNSLIALQVILQGIQDDYPDGVPDTLMIEMANKMNDLRSLIDAMCQKYDLWQQMELIEAMSGEQFNPAPLDTETENEG